MRVRTYLCMPISVLRRLGIGEDFLLFLIFAQELIVEKNNVICPFFFVLGKRNTMKKARDVFWKEDHHMDFMRNLQ